MSPRPPVIALCVVSFLTAQTKSPETDYLIVPGVRVGPVSSISTELSLRRSVGKVAVKREVAVGEGITEPGLVIYKDDPTRRLAVLWNAEKRPATIFICYDEVGTPCRWHTESGIGIGTTLKDLERSNGKPFQMMGWGTDVGGNVVSFEGGKLEQELETSGALILSLAPRTNKEGVYVPPITDEEFAAVQGEMIVPSNHPVLQKLNPYVATMRLEFSRK